MNTLHSLMMNMPGWHEIMTALPVIFSLIIIEGLLSVDNAMAIAALASGLPKHQQKFALRIGILGAYLMRGLSLGFVAYIAHNPWLKILGAAYLLYLMASNLAKKEEEEEGSGKTISKSLLVAVIQIEVMDLSLSLDNVVAAVALDKRLWVVCVGVFIGILALRFVAGYCIKLIEKFPILMKTAFLLIGFVGVTLLVELLGHIEVQSIWKFVGIILITAATLVYDNTKAGKKFLMPLVSVGSPLLRLLDGTLGAAFAPIVWVFGKIKDICLVAGGWVKSLFMKKAPAVVRD